MTAEPTPMELRDPEAVAKAMRWMAVLYDKYFRCEVEGIENVPRDRAILFGNHNGSSYTVEGQLLTVALLRHHGLDHKLYYLVHENFFDIPGLGKRLLARGAVPGSRANARRILEANGQFVTFPGGERSSHKPFTERHEVDFHGHTGYARIAIESRTPLVPFVHVGTHSTMLVLARGARIAKAFDLKRRMGLAVFPLVLSFPFGLSLGPYFAAIPLPAKVRMRVLPPVSPWELGWDDASDPECLRECSEHLTGLCQEALYDLRDRR